MTGEAAAAGRAYLTALGRLRNAVSREMDRAQVGREPGGDLSIAWDAVVEQRVILRAALLEEADARRVAAPPEPEDAGQEG